MILGGEDPLEKGMATHSSIWENTRQFHGPRSLVGYSPWGRKELDTTQQLNTLNFYQYYHWGNEQAIPLYYCSIHTRTYSPVNTRFSLKGKARKKLHKQFRGHPLELGAPAARFSAHPCPTASLPVAAARAARPYRRLHLLGRPRGPLPAVPVVPGPRRGRAVHHRRQHGPHLLLG